MISSSSSSSGLTCFGTVWPFWCWCAVQLWYNQSINHSVSLYDQLFWDTCRFEKSVPNDPKMTLKPTRSNVSHTCVTSIHESQISLRFTLRPAVFETQAILRQAHWMTPKLTLNSTRSKVFMYVLLVSLSLKFHPIFLNNQLFSRHKVVDNQKCASWPRNDLEHLIVKSTLYTLNTNLRGPYFCSFHSTTSCFQD